MMYGSQIIMQYTLNLYCAICQLYLSKTGRKKSDTGAKDGKQSTLKSGEGPSGMVAGI